MKELNISQAQQQFTSLLSATEVTTIIDKKNHLKKAVVMPYSLYEKLIASAVNTKTEQSLELEQFVGIFSDELQSDDVRYNAVKNNKSFVQDKVKVLSAERFLQQF